MKRAKEHTEWSGTQEIKTLTLTKEQSEESVAKLVESLTAAGIAVCPRMAVLFMLTHISVCVVRNKCRRCPAFHTGLRLANSFYTYY